MVKTQRFYGVVMDFDIEKLLIKASGENVESYTNTIISDADKAQIEFAFDEIFSGLSLLYWMKKITLADAWKNTLDDMRDYIFSIKETGFAVDYLRKAIFAYKTKKLKALESSVHANEYCPCDESKNNILEKSAKEKIQNGIDIIMNIIHKPKQTKVLKQNLNQNIKTNQQEHEYIREKK